MENNQRLTTISQSATEAVSVFNAATSLYEKNKKYESTVLARSNKVLYGILAEVLKLYQAAAAAKCLPDTTKEMKAALKERGMRPQANTPALTVFVRFVFNSDRKKAYTYANTLSAAIAEGIAPENLANFIEGKGGVEECKKEHTQSSEVTQKQQNHQVMYDDVVASLMSTPAKDIVDLGNVSVDLNDGTHFSFLIARHTVDGTFEVLQAVPTTTKAMESAALNTLTKFALAAKKESDWAGKKADAEKTTETAIASMTRKESLVEAEAA